MMIKYLIAGAIGVGALVSASDATAATRPNPLPPCKAKNSEIFVHYNKPMRCDVRPPQILTLIMPRWWHETTMNNYCDQLGGELEGRNLCFNIDY